MNIPAFINLKFVDNLGFLTAEMQYYNDELSQVLQAGLSDNGWTFPQISAVDLVRVEPDMPNGTGWYETDAHEMVFKINGALRKVTTTAYP